jgi:hypothetical protein
MPNLRDMKYTLIVLYIGAFLLWLVSPESDISAELSVLPLGIAAAISAAPGLITGGLGALDMKKRRNRIKDEYGGVTDQMQGVADNYSKDIGGIDSELGTNYLDTGEGNMFLQSIQNSGNQGRRSLMNNAGLMGLSDEAFVKGMGNISQVEASSISGLNQGATARRMGLQQMKAGLRGNRMNTIRSIFDSKRAAEMDAISGNSAFMSTLGSSLSQGAGQFLKFSTPTPTPGIAPEVTGKIDN